VLNVQVADGEYVLLVTDDSDVARSSSDMSTT